MPPRLIERRTLLITGMGLGMLPAFSASAGPTIRQALSGLMRFVGAWRGEGDGEPGHSTVERTYTIELDGQYLRISNASTYLPQPKNPKGEIHHDIGFYSFDDARKRAVLRQFHSEGFVNQYIAQSADLTADEIVFESEQIENIPAGYRARETYRFFGADRFEETFEIAEPGGDFQVYSHNTLHKA